MGSARYVTAKLTVGVLHRVEKLADRAEGDRPDVAMPFENLIPLPEIIGSVLQVGPTSKRVQTVYEQMLSTHGAELKNLARTAHRRNRKNRRSPHRRRHSTHARRHSSHRSGIRWRVRQNSSLLRRRPRTSERTGIAISHTSRGAFERESREREPRQEHRKLNSQRFFLHTSNYSLPTSHFTPANSRNHGQRSHHRNRGARHWKNPGPHPSRNRPDPEPRCITRFYNGRNIHQSRRN